MKKNVITASLFVCLFAFQSIAQGYRYFELTLKPSVILDDNELGQRINYAMSHTSCFFTNESERYACNAIQHLLESGQYLALSTSLYFFDQQGKDVVFTEF
ncbi:MAG TPA: hypothetical protein VI522_05250, partial [Gammaproteobacteria bacterium]|nr:hypothetical protein [Gammaproteobacteria bacterium]